MKVNKTTLYSVLLVVWLLVVAGALIYPLWRRVQTESAQLAKKQEKIAELETQSRQLNSLQQSLEKAKSDFETLDNLFVNHEAPVDFLEFLEQTAASSDVNIDIDPASGEKLDDTWTPSFFRVEGTGDFEDCAQFITKLEYAPYLIKMQSLELEEVERGEEEPVKKTKIDLLVKVY